MRSPSEHRQTPPLTGAHAAVGQRPRGNLGTGGLILTAMALNAPLAMMSGFLPVEIGLGVGAATPVVYLLVMAVVLVFAVGLLAMARHMSKPGAFYSYITAGLGRIPGLGAGFTALTGYLLLGAGGYVLAPIQIQQLVDTFLHGPTLPWWLWALAMWAVVSALSLLNIDVSTKVLGVFLCIEVVIVLFWDARVLFNGGPHGRGLDLAAQLGTGSPGVALLFGVASLIGFESLQVFRAETHDPNRTIPRASYLTVALLAVFYTVSSYAYLVGFGTDAALAGAATPTQSFLGSLAQYAGVAFRDVANVMLLTSGLAALLAMQNIGARYCFALGRDGALPSWLGQVHRRHHAPTRAAAVIAATILAAVALVAILRLDPVTTYVALTGLGLWAPILLLFTTSIAVIAFFRGHRDLENSAWKTLWAPALAALGFGCVLFEATLNSDVLIGGSTVVSLSCIAAIVAVAAGGMGYARWLRTHRPQVWRRIGDQDDTAGAEQPTATEV